MTALLGERRFVTDGGLETDLIFHHDADLPAFAAFTLLRDEHGRELLEQYFREHLETAAAHGFGVVLETPTWRASSAWAQPTGSAQSALARQVGVSTTAPNPCAAAVSRCSRKYCRSSSRPRSSRSRVKAAKAGSSTSWWKMRSVSSPESVTSTDPSSCGRVVGRDIGSPCSAWVSR